MRGVILAIMLVAFTLGLFASLRDHNPFAPLSKPDAATILGRTGGFSVEVGPDAYYGVRSYPGEGKCFMFDQMKPLPRFCSGEGQCFARVTAICSIPTKETTTP